jgi:glutaconate CoA-transferase subunit A
VKEDKMREAMGTFETKRKSKVITLEEAASMVKDGMKLGLGGMMSWNGPNAFVREVIRKGVKDLALIPTNVAGYQIDILLGAGCVKKLYMSYIGFEFIGFAPNFRRLCESGKLDVVELDEEGLLQAQKAGGIGVAFFPLPDGMLAVDTVKRNPDWYKVVEDPFTGKKVVVVPPLRSDICVLHAGKCDPYGNAQEIGNPETLLYRSADKVIITAEEIVPLENTMANYRGVTVMGSFVDAVVEVPYGCHPGECSGYYTLDEGHLRKYIEAGKTEDTFKKYLDEYIYKLKNHEEYLEKIGIAKLISQLKYRYS